MPPPHAHTHHMRHLLVACSVAPSLHSAWTLVHALWRTASPRKHALHSSCLVVSCPQVPDHIPKPDYYDDGIPTAEQESRQQASGARAGLDGWFGVGPAIPGSHSRDAVNIALALVDTPVNASSWLCCVRMPLRPAHTHVLLRRTASHVQHRAVPVRGPKEVAGMRAACRVGREVLDVAAAAARPGVTTDELDRIVHEAMIERNAYPSPLNYYNFPKSVCTSINEVICHGVPDQRELQSGDILNIDVTAYYQGCGLALRGGGILGGGEGSGAAARGSAWLGRPCGQGRRGGCVRSHVYSRCGSHAVLLGGLGLGEPACKRM